MTATQAWWMSAAFVAANVLIAVLYDYWVMIHWGPAATITAVFRWLLGRSVLILAAFLLMLVISAAHFWPRGPAPERPGDDRHGRHRRNPRQKINF